MANQQAASNGGIGFTGLLTIVFITLKLTNVIAWEWVWVLSPIWIMFLFWLVILAAMFCMHLIMRK